MGSIPYGKYTLFKYFVFDGRPWNGKYTLFNYFVFDLMPWNGKYTLSKYFSLTGCRGEGSIRYLSILS